MAVERLLSDDIAFEATVINNYHLFLAMMSLVLMSGSRVTSFLTIINAALFSSILAIICRGEINSLESGL